MSEVQKNKEYKIYKIKIKDKLLSFQLQNLGFIQGEKIKLLFDNYGKKSFLVEVMGVKYAIDKVVADEVIVYE